MEWGSEILIQATLFCGMDLPPLLHQHRGILFKERCYFCKIIAKRNCWISAPYLDGTKCSRLSKKLDLGVKPAGARCVSAPSVIQVGPNEWEQEEICNRGKADELYKTGNWDFIGSRLARLTARVKNRCSFWKWTGRAALHCKNQLAEMNHTRVVFTWHQSKCVGTVGPTVDANK